MTTTHPTVDQTRVADTPDLPAPWGEQYQAMRRLLERLDRGDVALPQRTIRTVMNKVRDLDPKKDA